MADANQRPTRADEVRQERRRKAGPVANMGKKLAVDESMLDRKRYEYRWVNDAGARMSRLHSEDWDPAPEFGSVESKTAGVDEQGKPFGAVLMRKCKDWYEEDQKAKRRPLDEMDAAIRAGKGHMVGTGAETALQSGTYSPVENRIERS